jgi:hypothetical protein
VEKPILITIAAAYSLFDANPHVKYVRQLPRALEIVSERDGIQGIQLIKYVNENDSLAAI